MATASDANGPGGSPGTLCAGAEVEIHVPPRSLPGFEGTDPLIGSVQRTDDGQLHAVVDGHEGWTFIIFEDETRNTVAAASCPERRIDGGVFPVNIKERPPSLVSSEPPPVATDSLDSLFNNNDSVERAASMAASAAATPRNGSPDSDDKSAKVPEEDDDDDEASDDDGGDGESSDDDDNSESEDSESSEDDDDDMPALRFDGESEEEEEEAALDMDQLSTFAARMAEHKKASDAHFDVSKFHSGKMLESVRRIAAEVDTFLKHRGATRDSLHLSAAHAAERATLASKIQRDPDGLRAKRLNDAAARTDDLFDLLDKTVLPDIVTVEKQAVDRDARMHTRRAAEATARAKSATKDDGDDDDDDDMGLAEAMAVIGLVMGTRPPVVAAGRLSASLVGTPTRTTPGPSLAPSENAATNDFNLTRLRGDLNEYFEIHTTTQKPSAWRFSDHNNVVGADGIRRPFCAHVSEKGRIVISDNGDFVLFRKNGEGYPDDLKAFDILSHGSANEVLLAKKPSFRFINGSRCDWTVVAPYPGTHLSRREFVVSVPRPGKPPFHPCTTFTYYVNENTPGVFYPTTAQRGIPVLLLDHADYGVSAYAKTLQTRLASPSGPGRYQLDRRNERGQMQMVFSAEKHELRTMLNESGDWHIEFTGFHLDHLKANEFHVKNTKTGNLFIYHVRPDQPGIAFSYSTRAPDLCIVLGNDSLNDLPQHVQDRVAKAQARKKIFDAAATRETPPKVPDEVMAYCSRSPTSQYIYVPTCSIMGRLIATMMADAGRTHDSTSHLYVGLPVTAFLFFVNVYNSEKADVDQVD